VRAGKLKALGTSGKSRSSVLPEVPTVSEAGVPGYEAVIWLGIMAPAATPKAVVDRLNAEITRAANAPEEAFRKARSEKEEHWQYLNSVVQQVRTGILSFDTDGNVQLMNANAKRFLGITSIKNIKELINVNPKLYHAINSVELGKSELYKGTNEIYLTIQSTELRIR
jgi:PAS domain-containing protein